MSEFFDYESAAAEAGLTERQLEALRRRVEADYPDDPMMVELRLLRICHAIQAAACTLDDALKPEPKVLPSRSR